MSEDRHEKTEGARERAEDLARKTQAVAQGWFGHLREVWLQPELFFSTEQRSERVHVLIDWAVFAALLYLSVVIGRAFGYAGADFEFRDLVAGFKSLFAVGLPLAALPFLLNWQAGRSGGRDGVEFYLEKIGGALLLPAALWLLVIVFEVLDARIHGWFGNLAMDFVVVAVFAITLAHAAPGRIRVAVLYTAGFSFAVWLMGRLLW